MIKDVKKITVILILFCFASCDPFSHIEKRELSIGSEKIYFLSKSWGIGSGHYKVLVSKDKSIDEYDLDLGESFDILYSIEQNKLVIHSYKKLQVPNKLKDFVEIKYYDDKEYIKFKIQLDKNEISGIELYQPFEKREP